MNIDQFLAGLRAVESGGSYTAEGPRTSSGDRAYGRYQVMGSNVGPWTAKYYGRALTPQQFLANKAAQDAVASGVLQHYYNTYGSWESAAAMWFSGQPNPNSQRSDGYLTVQQYVQKVMSNAGSASAGGGGTSATPQADTINLKDLESQYGFTGAFLKAYPELKKLFDDQVKYGWDKATFDAKLKGTNWWKTHSQSERDYITLGYNDKASANQKYDQALVHVRQLGESLGITYAKTKDQVAQAAYNVVAKGWNDEQVRNYLGAYVYFDTSQGFHPGGEGQNVSDQIVQYSYQMGVKNAGHWYGDWARKIIRGLATVDDAKAEIRKQAMAMFPQYSKQLLAGSTVQDLASPYIQSMQNILELNPGSITMFDRTIKKAMAYKDSNGKAAAMPLWSFENYLRQDPRWKQTKNAQDSIFGVAHGVLQDMGLVT